MLSDNDKLNRGANRTVVIRTANIISQLKRVFSGPIIGLIALSVFFGLFTPSFLTIRNFINILNQMSIFGVLAVGMTFVIITGGIDLSVGCILGLASMVFGYSMEYLGLPIGVALMLAFLVGPLMGLITGLSITITRLPPFIATLAMYYVARGLANIITGGTQILGYPEWFVLLSYQKYFGFLTITSVVFIVTALIAWLFLTFTAAGRSVYAVGGSEEVARLSGIRVSVVKTATYVFSGTLSSVAGILMASRVNASEPYQGNGYELYTIAIAVIGGASLKGGAGTIGGTLIGAFIIGILNNALNLNGISPFVQTVLIGVIIALAVGLDMYTRSRKSTVSYQNGGSDA